MAKVNGGINVNAYDMGSDFTSTDRNPSAMNDFNPMVNPMKDVATALKENASINTVP